MHGGTPPDFSPPVKCNIIASSQPIQNFLTVQSFNSIQDIVYKASNADIERWEANDYCSGKPLISKEWHETWAKENNLNLTYKAVLALNSFVATAFNIYKGVEVKVANKNEKINIKKILYQTRLLMGMAT